MTTSPRDFTKNHIFVLASYVAPHAPEKVDTCDEPCFYSRGYPEAPFGDSFIDLTMIGG